MSETRRKVIIVTNKSNIPQICCDGRGNRRYPKTGFVATPHDLELLGGLGNSAVRHRDARVLVDAIDHPEASIMVLRIMDSQKIGR